jgi:hypothetical protein
MPGRDAGVRAVERGDRGVAAVVGATALFPAETLDEMALLFLADEAEEVWPTADAAGLIFAAPEQIAHDGPARQRVPIGSPLTRAATALPQSAQWRPVAAAAPQRHAQRSAATGGASRSTRAINSDWRETPALPNT